MDLDTGPGISTMRASILRPMRPPSVLRPSRPTAVLASACSGLLLIAGLLISSAAAAAEPAATAGGAVLIKTCSYSALAKAVLHGGTATFGCHGTIDFSKPIVVPSGDKASVSASGETVVLDGQDTSQLFVVDGSLVLTDLTLENGKAAGKNGAGGKKGTRGKNGKGGAQGADGTSGTGAGGAGTNGSAGHPGRAGGTGTAMAYGPNRGGGPAITFTSVPVDALSLVTDPPTPSALPPFATNKSFPATARVNG